MSKEDKAFRSENWNDALKHLLVLEKADSKLLQYRANVDMSEAYRRLGKLEESKKCAKKAIDLDPNK